MVGGVLVGIGWFAVEAAEVGVGGKLFNMLGPRVGGGGDEAVDAVGAGEEFGGGWGEAGGAAVEVVPAGFDVGGLDAEGFLGEGAFLGVGDVDDAALGVNSGEGKGKRPGEQEIAESAEVEDEDVAVEHGFRVRGSGFGVQGEDFVDPAAGEEDVVVVEDDGLAGGDGMLRLLEVETEFVGGGDGRNGGLGGVIVTDFGGAKDGVTGGVRSWGEPIGLVGDEGAAEEGVFVADGDLVGVGVDVDDVDGVAKGEADAFALADGEMLVAGVLADDLAGGVDDLAGAEGIRGSALDEGGVVLVGNEADFLRIGFVVDGEFEVEGDLSDVGFFVVSDGQEGMFDGGGSHAEEDVALVFAVVEAAEECGGAGDGVGADAGVVAGGDIVGADGFCVGGEFAELEPIVAADAGIGCSAAVVFGDEVVDDAAEVILEIEDVEGDLEDGGDFSGVVGVEDGAAALLGVGGVAGVVGLDAGWGAEAHEHADDVVALAEEQSGGDGGIDSATHGDDDFGLLDGHCVPHYRRAGARGIVGVVVICRLSLVICRWIRTVGG